MKIIVILFSLLLFGTGYNRVVVWLQKQGLGDFTALQVVFGCLVVLLGLTIWLPSAGLPALGCFAAAGTPMFIGSAQRWQQNRRAG